MSAHPEISPENKEILLRAQGTDVLSPDILKSFASAAANVKSWRLKWFFNTRDGWLLRRVARGHFIKHTKRMYCSLCGANTKGPQRPQTTVMCSLCSTPLCTVPRVGEDGLCCFQEWI